MGEAGIDHESNGGAAGAWIAHPVFRFLLICIVLATLINSVVADVRMRMQPSPAPICEKMDEQFWSCDRSGNVFILCEDFKPADAPLLNMVYYRGNYILWPRRIVVPDSSKPEISRELLFNHTIPDDKWLAEHGVRTLLLYKAGSMPPMAFIYNWKPSESTRRVVAAPQEPQTAATGEAIVWCCIYILVLMLSGYAAVCFAFDKERRWATEILGASAALGTAIVSLCLIVLSMCGSILSREAILEIGALSVVILVIQATRHRLAFPAKSAKPWLRLRPIWGVFPIIAIVYGIATLAFDAVIRPTIMWDAFAIWQLKAKVLLYETLAAHPAYFMDPSFNYSHLRYPILLPMLSAGVHAIVGHVDEILDKAPCLLLYLAMGAMVFGLIRSWRGGLAALLATALLMTADPTLYLGGTGTADIAMCALGAGSFVYLLRWLADHRRGDLVMLFLFSAACMWTKNEGQAVAVANVLVLWVLAPGPLRPRTLAMVGILALLLFLSYLPWMYYIKGMPRTDEDYAGRLSPANIIRCLSNVPHVAAAVLRQMIDFKLKGGFWLLPLVLVVSGGWRVRSRPVIALWMLIVLHVSIWIVVFIVTPLNFDTLLPAVGGRLLMQLAPAAALLIGLLWPTGDSSQTLPATK